MEENSKKRSRKAKLVPRQYVDSDDENIALMQQEIEMELAKMRSQTLLKKLSNKRHEPTPDLQFTVKVEIEEFNEEHIDDDILCVYPKQSDSKGVKESEVIILDDDSASQAETTNAIVLNIPKAPKERKSKSKETTAPDINIKIESVRTLSTDITYYIITKEMIMAEFQIIKKNLNNYTDKLLEIHLNNYFGRTIAEEVPNPSDLIIQEALKKWKDWQEEHASIRDAPLMYICSFCRTAMWHLHDYKEHMKSHKKYACSLYTSNHISYLSGKMNRNLKFSFISSTTDCWRCGKDIQFHNDELFKCYSCNQFFDTCTQLAMHEGQCADNKKFYKVVDNKYVEFNCPICPWKHWKKEKLDKHVIGYHSPRSDYPLPCSPKKCKKCNQSFNNYMVHDCPCRVKKEVCGFCQRMFQSRHNLLLHHWMAPTDFECRVCGKRLKKECEEVRHLTEHSNNYKIMYKCLTCKDSMCFLDQQSVLTHKEYCKRDIVKDPDGYFEIVVPNSLLQKLKPMKLDELNTIENLKAFDNACQELSRSKNKRQNKSDKNVKMTKLTGKNSDLDENIAKTEITEERTPHILNQTLNNRENVNELPSYKLCNYLNTYSRSKTKKQIETTTTDSDKDVYHYVLLDVVDVKDEPMDSDEANETVEINQVSEVDEINEDIQIVEDNQMIGVDEFNGINVINEDNQANEINQINDSNQIKVEISNKVKEVTKKVKIVDTNEVKTVDDSEDIEIKSEISDDLLSSAYDIDDDETDYQVKEEEIELFEDNILVVNEDYINAPTPSNTGRRKRTTKVNNIQSTSNEKYMKAMRDDVYGFKCTKCNTCYNTFKHYVTHFVKHDYKHLACPKCFRTLHSRQELVSHVNAHIKHSYVSIRSISSDLADQKNCFRCKTCKHVLTVKDFFKHWEHHLDVQPVVVKVESSINMDDKPNLKEMIALLKDSEKTPSDWKMRSCRECQKRFDRKNDYKRHFIEHLLTDANSERYRYGHLKCQICGEGFACVDGYKRHLRDHASLPVYKCEICDKAFSDSSNFSKHKKVHNLSVLICDICKKKFHNKRYLIKHLEMHQLIKPIVCETCNKVFYSKSLYSKHLKKNRPRVKCHVCVMSFATLKEKWDHLWEVHLERKYKADCPFCSKPFRKHVDVKKHIRNDHNNLFHIEYNRSGV